MCVKSLSGSKPGLGLRSEEHTSELQSLRHLVCRLLLEKKKKTINTMTLKDGWQSQSFTGKNLSAKLGCVTITTKRTATLNRGAHDQLEHSHNQRLAVNT